MANELDQLTVNAAGTGWVDSVPGPVSTGYQAQNTNVQARTVGQDLSSCRVSGTDVIVDISGPIDVDGLPFSITSAVTLSPTSGSVYYIEVIAGSTATQKSLQLTTSSPVWDADKNALLNGSNRVLNWRIDYTSDLLLYKLLSPIDIGIYAENASINGFVIIGGNVTVTGSASFGEATFTNQIGNQGGIKPAAWLEGSVSENQIYDTFAGLLDIANPRIMCSGNIGSTVISRILRTGSTTIRFYGGASPIDITDGGTTNYTVSISA